tara:strand:- start:500 stop:709 length:210 start_codon:yes stop_codon:yes gene_type:complete
MNKNIIDIDTIEDIKNIYDLNSYINNLEIIEKLNDEKDELINNLKEENMYKTIIIEKLINHINVISDLK